MEKRLIYSLSCPFTKEVHYVGKSNSGMVRALSHLKKSHSDKVNEWIAELKIFNKFPSIDILELVPEFIDLDQRERYWIQHMINTGNTLLNSNLIQPITINANLEYFTDSDGFDFRKISEFVKTHRKRVNLTQEEFTQKAGIGLRFLRKIEQGNQNIMLPKLIQVLNMFGAEIEIVKRNK